MPVILSQHFLASDRVYEDVEYSLYHYPSQYFSRIVPYDRFIYYRPLGESRRRIDSLHYFGHGILGQPFADPRRPDHRYVPLIKAEPFPRLVPLRDEYTLYYETESEKAPVAVSAVREINPIVYHRILAAARVMGLSLERMPSTEDLQLPAFALAPHEIPRDDLREIDEIPSGAGYVPKGDTVVNVYEAAALQERARADHQSVLQHLSSMIKSRGGRTWYNNNIDLLGDVGGRKLLIEAKSLNNPVDAVNRMRYGMGQLFDYRFRYREQIGDALPVLAFGNVPDRNTLWIGEVLQENGVAFVGQERENIIAMNDLAVGLPIFDIN